MIKTIIFDNNGVLTTSDGEDGYSKVARFLGVEMSVLKPVWQGKLAQDLDEGKLNTNNFLGRVMSEVGVVKDLDAFRKIYFQRYAPKEEVREFARKISKDFEIALLTNFGDSFHTFNKRWKVEELFDKDKIFLSCEMKMRKPNKDIFLYALKKLGRKPEETVFIDDHDANVEAASKLGMHAIQFKTLKQVEKDLENILQYDYV